MALCGIDYPPDPVIWLPAVLASIVYLIPTLVPWRRAAILAACILAFFILAGVYDIVAWPNEDICDPPYFKEEFRTLVAASAWALAVAGYLLFFSATRPVERCERVQWGRLLAFYCLAVVPAIVVKLF